MGTPVQTQIMDLVGARLANVTTLNGYSVDLAKKTRASILPFKNSDLPAINYYYTGDGLVKALNSGQEERILLLIVEFYDTTRDRVFLDVADELSADVKIALERSVDAPAVSDLVSHLLGKKVMKLEFDTITPAIGAGQQPYCGAVLAINITYRVDRNDPFTLIDY